MPENEFNAILLRENDLSAPRSMEIAGGRAVLFSRRCPDREGVNEDSAAAIAVTAASGVLAIADGVGGMQSGHHASAVAVDSLAQKLQSGNSAAGQLRTAVLDTFELANERILNMGANAATTLAVIEIEANRIRPYHAGDSMILLCGQRGRLRWQSISHSPVGYAVESGIMDEADAMSHPERHVVSNVVGCPDMRIEIGPPLEMNPRDTLLLCSDGLSDNLTTEEIIANVRSGDLVEAVQNLVDIATRRMVNREPVQNHPSKPDDLTIVAFRRLPAAKQNVPSGRDQPVESVPDTVHPAS